MCVGCEGLTGSDEIRAAFARVRGQAWQPCDVLAARHTIGLFGEQIMATERPLSIFTARSLRPKNPNGVSVLAAFVAEAPPRWWKSRAPRRCFLSAPLISGAHTRRPLRNSSKDNIAPPLDSFFSAALAVGQDISATSFDKLDPGSRVWFDRQNGLRVADRDLWEHI
jgi:hypothetical protein